MRTLLLTIGVLLCVDAVRAQSVQPTHVNRAIKAACPSVTGIRLFDYTNKATWTVTPVDQQACAQPVIDAFTVTDPAHEQAELDTQAKAALDNERLSSAIVWTILKQMFPADTDAQTRTKFGVARTRIIDAYKAKIWVAP